MRWEVTTGRRELPLRHHRQDERSDSGGVGTNGSEPIRGTVAAYRPDGQSIVSAGMDQCVMLWDIKTRQILDQVQTGNNIWGFSISPDGKTLAMAEQLPGIEILDLEQLHGPRRSMAVTSNRVGTVAFSPGGRTLAVAGHGGRRTDRRPRRAESSTCSTTRSICHPSHWRSAPAGRHAGNGRR